MKLFGFRGGVKPASHKVESNQTPIAPAPLSERLAVPLHQSIGGTPRPIVRVGDTVAQGQRIGDADGWISAAVHAPTSGRVVAIEPTLQPHPSGLEALSVIIEPDGEERWIERTPIDPSRHSPDAVRQVLQQAGVVGMGGAAFPAHAKLTVDDGPLEALVINGAECEPWITCDDRLMRERAADIVAGTVLFRDLLSPKRVIIGVEDNKPEAAEALRSAVRQSGQAIEVVTVPTRYPAGGAKQLIRVLTGISIPGMAKRTTDYGVQCFNVGTAYTAHRAIAHGEPVVSRVVTVTGHVARPGNWEVPIGTPASHLLALAGALPGRDGLILGGPMMGFRAPADTVPVIKATNCLIATSPTLFPPPEPELACIRCGKCAEACPHELQPFEMYWWSRAKNFGKAQEYNVFECIECGCCAYVCPSRIPLVQYFRFAKSEIWARERDKQAAEAAKSRFEFKQFRDTREKEEKAERLAKAAAAQKAKADAAARPTAGESPGSGATATEAPTNPADPAATPTDAAAAKKALIAAAMARAQQQKAAAADPTAASPLPGRDDAPAEKTE